VPSKRAGWTLRRQIYLNCGTAIPAGLLFGYLGGQRAIDDLAISVGVSATYANLIGTPAVILLPAVTRRMRGRPALAHWLAFVGTLLGIAVAGCLVAGLFFVGIGLIAGSMYWPTFLEGTKIAVLMSVMFGVGAFSLDRLTDRLRQTELAEERARKLAAEASLSALAARVRPHFLFNALNSIAALVAEDPAAAEALIGRLAQLLRFTLETDGTVLVALGRELEIVRDYLEIERVRFGARLHSQVQAVPDLEATLVPPFSVQTLVENSVKHAVAARRMGGAVKVSASASNGSVEVRVWDDGPGFDETAVRAGHGIDTVRGRLQAHYGARARLDLRREGEGMTVSFRVPA
jgi:signal transduction histidine kinase